MVTDPLSDILALLRPRSAISVGLDIAGDWCFSFPSHVGIKFNAVMHGECYLRMDGSETWHHLRQGSCFLLTLGLPFTLASDPSLPPRPAAILYRDVTGPVANFNGGGDLFLIGGRFTFEGEGAALLAALPPVLLLDSVSPEASVLQWSLTQLTDELRQHRPGGALLSEHLAHLMLVHILRLYLERAAPGEVSWLQALADRHLGRALSALHAEPARSWTLAELAARAGLSRTVFAERFRRVVGLSAGDYLIRWRMLLARDRLRHTADGIGQIALSVGYQSEAAFSTAFKRVTDLSPRQYRRGMDATPRMLVSTSS
ncbi:MAG: AraC family transcriptional regulator [Candidatus Devosia phytovorans]|uniref:AraC family transcriptional regulator n=1 Tax=Candidatus Devosia phytovorans TaxID=3121372 RepID=A0AAJ5VW96_9HYPH|nr:AraC family transcriptional regulator [Devosia sp.]WEK05266.1 MAG: AraC family transcriptional regulator [Devosia sp.]